MTDRLKIVSFILLLIMLVALNVRSHRERTADEQYVILVSACDSTGVVYVRYEGPIDSIETRRWIEYAENYQPSYEPTQEIRYFTIEPAPNHTNAGD
jgi:hypothetical protein